MFVSWLPISKFNCLHVRLRVVHPKEPHVRGTPRMVSPTMSLRVGATVLRRILLAQIYKNPLG